MWEEGLSCRSTLGVLNNYSHFTSLEKTTLHFTCIAWKKDKFHGRTRGNNKLIYKLVHWLTSFEKVVRKIWSINLWECKISKYFRRLSSVNKCLILIEPVLKLLFSSGLTFLSLWTVHMGKKTSLFRCLSKHQNTSFEVSIRIIELLSISLRFNVRYSNEDFSIWNWRRVSDARKKKPLGSKLLKQ